MKIRVDENLPVEVARIFIDKGHDVLTAIDQGMGGKRS
jgi:predicted nuclease of predicted toxin-antitoxin system